jgi:hypothetical protein
MIGQESTQPPDPAGRTQKSNNQGIAMRIHRAVPLLLLLTAATATAQAPARHRHRRCRRRQRQHP